MDYTPLTSQIKDIVQKAKDIVIVTHERPTADAIGASLALYLGLIHLGKKVTIACPDAMTVELSSFVGVNKIVSEIGKKNFVISLDYTEGSIEKVSYNIEGNKFNLVIEPRVGFETFGQDKVHFAHTGIAADAVIAIDTIHLGGLKKLYEENKELFASKPVINIDRHPNNVQFGQINVIDVQASSTAELVFSVLTATGVELTQDIATNLLNALYGATNNFTSTLVTTQAFELAASCMKAGGRRFRRSTPTTPQVSEEVPQGEEARTGSIETGIPSVAPTTQMHSQQPSQPSVQMKKPQEAPADWLKPKIFKSSSLG